MKKNKQIAPLCILIAIIIFVLVLVAIVKGSIDEYNSAKDRNRSVAADLEVLRNQDKELSQKREKDELELRSIKPVYQAPDGSVGDNLGVFGSMFERIINMAKANGLLLRSIEYDMNPQEDPVNMDYGDTYNVCELKFFFVGTYIQLRSFISAITNNFEYLVSISKLNVTSFASNTDYLLINMSITLYSKKPGKASK